MNISPALQFTLLCDDIRREDNGKFMFLGLFETIGGLRFPLKHPRLYVANRWCKGVGSFKEKIRLIQEESAATVIQSQETSFELKGIEHYHTSINRFDGIVFPAAGKYFVEVLLNGELVISYPVILTLLKE